MASPTSGIKSNSVTATVSNPSKKREINKEAVFWITVIHLAALAAIPFFSWSAFAVCMILLFTISPIGVTMTYHRLLTHRSFKVPRWFEYVLATIGALSAQGSPLDWVAGHRIHHKYSDTPKDIHSPHDGFFFSHLGHLFYWKDHERSDALRFKYVPDLAKQKYYRFLHKYNLVIAISILPVLYAFGGVSWLLWGGFVRVVLMLHFTWFVNSATHTWGYRNFETKDNSRNCWWVALLAAGEGWHNNHHAEQNCAAHGRKAWEFDLTYLIIRALGRLGLATHINRPRPVLALEKKTAAKLPNFEIKVGDGLFTRVQLPAAPALFHSFDAKPATFNLPVG
jgi:fatty-acid desaturase